MDASSSFDAIVIGAGIMGSCAAYHLSSKLNQQSTLLLERFDLLHPLGSSHGLSRTTRSTYPEPFYPPLVSLSRSLFLDAQSEAGGGYTVLTPTPHLDMGPISDLSFKSCIDNSSTSSPTDDHVKLLAKESLRDKFSGAFHLPDQAEGWVALETPLGGVLHPTKSVAMFQSLAARHGVVVRDRTEVTSIKKEASLGGAVQVLTASGEVLYGKKVIITAGAWTRKLVESVSGIELPIEPVHTLICYWKIREGLEGALKAAAGFPTFASYGDPYIYGTPCMEYPNLIKIAMHGGIPCDPDRRDWQVGSRSAADDDVTNAALVGPVAQWISKFMPSHVDASNGPVMTQGCMYSMTPDGDFIIDFLGGVFGKDVVVAGGFSGHGFKMGPAVGKILAEMAVWGEAAVPDGVDMAKFSIGRFQSNPGGNVKVHAPQVSMHKTT